MGCPSGARAGAVVLSAKGCDNEQSCDALSCDALECVQNSMESESEVT